MRCQNSKRIIVLVPYPAQGHVTPMLNLATALVGQGYEPLVVTPDYIHRRIIAPRAHKQTETHGVAFASVPDGLGEDEPRDFFSIETAMENDMPRHLERLLVGELGVAAVACVVVDLLASWAIDVSRRCGVHVAGFWPAMLSTYRLIAAVPDMVRSGLISETGSPQYQGTIQFQPNQPSLSTEELPWLIGTSSVRRARFKFWTRALSRSRTLNFILVNSFPDESPEPNLPESHISTPTLLPIAKPRLPTPTIPSPRSFWDEDASCLQWLDEREPDSVIYISFGSWVSPIGESKIRSLAAALESLSGRYFFLWVLGQSWRSGLPEGFEERVKSIGKIVSWAPQMEVLRHESVGFYMTHCGWNSTLEAVECRKRMICYPIAGDQFLNCGYIVKVWKIGVRICGFGEREVVEGLKRVAEDVEMPIRLRKIRDKVMGDEAGFRAKSNLSKFVDFLGKQTNA